MKNAKSSAVVLGLGFVLAILALFAISYSMGPTVVEKPVYVNRYIQDTVPVYVQPSWWSFYGPPWGYKSGYDKPWKMGSGLPGMKVPPPPPPAPSTPPPGPEPVQPPPSPPSPPPST